MARRDTLIVPLQSGPSILSLLRDLQLLNNLDIAHVNITCIEDSIENAEPAQNEQKANQGAELMETMEEVKAETSQVG